MREGAIPNDRNRLYVVSRRVVCGAREGIRPYVSKVYQNSPICANLTPLACGRQSKGHCILRKLGISVIHFTYGACETQKKPPRVQRGALRCCYPVYIVVLLKKASVDAYAFGASSFLSNAFTTASFAPSTASLAFSAYSGAFSFTVCAAPVTASLTSSAASFAFCVNSGAFC